MKNKKLKRIIKWVVVVVVVLSLSIWIKSRWRAWFHNMPETEFTVATEPERITLTPGEDFMSERNVAWRCGDSIQDSKLYLAHNGDTTEVKAEGAIVESRAGKDAFYAAHITKLIPNDTYSYRVQTASASSRWYTFVMPEMNVEKRRFIYFGDVQDTIGGNSHEWFAKLYRNFKDVDFWACGGDLVEAPVDKYWNYFFSTTDSIFSEIPLINATGNHDYIKSLHTSVDPRWQHTFVYPHNGASTAMGESYFIDMPDMRYIVLDSNSIQDCMSIFGQYQWLRKALQGAGGKWKVVMFHHPIYSVRKGRNNFMIRNTFLPLIEKYGVHLVLQGHEHGYLRKVSEQGDHPVFIVSYMSPKSYKSRQSEDGTKIVADHKMYQVIDYTKDTMELKAYDLDSDSIIDEVKIKK